MKAEIFAIGTELLMGELTDTNSAWLAARLPALGIDLQGVCILGDHLAMLTEGLTRALQRVDLVLTTGGLGPTQDDLTREGIAAALGETPTVDAAMVQEIARSFQRRGRDMPAPNIKQAQLIFDQGLFVLLQVNARHRRQQRRDFYVHHRAHQRADVGVGHRLVRKLVAQQHAGPDAAADPADRAEHDPEQGRLHQPIEAQSARMEDVGQAKQHGAHAGHTQLRR